MSVEEKTKIEQDNLFCDRIINFISEMDLPDKYESRLRDRFLELIERYIYGPDEIDYDRK